MSEAYGSLPPPGGCCIHLQCFVLDFLATYDVFLPKESEEDF